MYNLATKLVRTLDKLKDIGGMMKKMGSGVARMLLPRPIRQWGGYLNNRRQQRNMRGASSPIPNARPTIDPTTGRPNGQVTYQQPRNWRERRRLERERRRSSGTVRQGVDGANNTRRSRGLGRLRDFWLGERYIPEERTDRRGRRYNQIRTRQGGVMRTNAQGQVSGRDVRTGGMRGAIRNGSNRVANSRPVTRARGLARLTNMINFADAGMDYNQSVGQRGHRRRSVVAGVKGFFNRSRQSGISAGGNSLASQLSARRGEVNQLGGRGSQRGQGASGGRGGGRGAKFKLPKLNLKGMLTSGLKGLGNIGGKVGTMLTKGLGTVVKKGLPLIFKGALRAIPFVGWALMAWDAVKLIFTNWDAIKSGASTAWNWIKSQGMMYLGMAWDWVREKASGIWSSITSFASTAWTTIQTGISTAIGFAWDWIKEKASGIWTSITSFATTAWTTISSGISTAISTAWEWIRTKASEVWTSITTFGTNAWTTMKNGLQTALGTAWNWVKTKANEILESVKGLASSAWSSIKSTASSTFTNMFQGIKDAWNDAKSFVTNNPITQTINKVVNTVTGKGGGKKGKGARTGEWMVPRDNMPYNLHQGEMVLTRKESQIMRSLVGSDSNSISEFLLKRGKGERPDMAIASKITSPKAIKAPSVTVKEETPKPTGDGGGTTEIKFEAGSIQIQVANASDSEIKKGARQLFEEFKRMIELQNMKNYKPARPRTR